MFWERFAFLKLLDKIDFIGHDHSRLSQHQCDTTGKHIFKPPNLALPTHLQRAGHLAAPTKGHGESWTIRVEKLLKASSADGGRPRRGSGCSAPPGSSDFSHLVCMHPRGMKPAGLSCDRTTFPVCRRKRRAPRVTRHLLWPQPGIPSSQQKPPELCTQCAAGRASAVSDKASRKPV